MRDARPMRAYRGTSDRDRRWNIRAFLFCGLSYGQWWIQLMLSIIGKRVLQTNVGAMNYELLLSYFEDCAGLLAGAPGGSTRIRPIMPPSSCSRRWQW